jgi:hypothetical protein
MPSSGLLRCVTLVRTDVSGECIASKITGRIISENEHLMIMMEGTRSSEHAVTSQKTTFFRISSVS